MGCTLHQHGHSHGGASHGHSHGGGHGHSRRTPPKSQTHQNGGFEPDRQSQEHDPKECSGDSDQSSSTQVTVSKPNINVRAAYIHVIGDFLQSVGVFAAALVIYFQVFYSNLLKCIIYL